MRICSNCGTTNAEDNDKFCRTCGALLPVKRPPRIRMESQFFTPKKNNDQELNLQEIPKESPKKMLQKKLSARAKPKVKELKKIDASEISDSAENDEKFLREIKPKPFSGSIIASREVYGSPKSSIEQINQENQLSTATATINDSKTDDALYKRKRLEEDMTNVLGFLSEKLKSIKSEETQKSKPKLIKETLMEKIPPTNLNEILNDLIKLDLHIEASALIEKDGKILASAISNRISDSLFATIGQNLMMIGKDIIDGLSAGKLKSISLRGTDGILDLAPIDKSMILIIFSHPKIKSGILSMAVSIVKKQIKVFLTANK